MSAPLPKHLLFPRVHGVYEYDVNYRPHGSSWLRLIRPFLHPALSGSINASFDLTFQGQPASIVILDRLWRPDVTLPLVERLVDRVRAVGARFVYSLDDSFFDLVLENKPWPPPEYLPILEYCLQQADGVMVSTPQLAARLQHFVPTSQGCTQPGCTQPGCTQPGCTQPERWVVLPNALDERLLVRRWPPLPEKRVVIGVMGTVTHDDDLMLILPALQAVCRRHPGTVVLQIVGVTSQSATQERLQSLPVRYLNPSPQEQAYPLFMPWFTAQARWDIALAPLRDTPFNASKSDIKFLDYAAIGAAGVFSRLPPYQSSVQHLENGWLAENTPDAWEEALETLIADVTLRRRIAHNAMRYLYQHRTLARRAGDWLQAVQTWLGDTP